MTETITEKNAITCTIIDLPPDIAAALQVSPDARAMLTVREGNLSIEILPPVTPRIEAHIQRVLAKYRDAFEELQKLGD